jgi:hypothetical protein
MITWEDWVVRTTKQREIFDNTVSGIIKDQSENYPWSFIKEDEE